MAAGGRGEEGEEDFSGRIKDLEEKLRGTTSVQKKPRDLLRAIGKIEKTDWQVKEIEKKIEENRFGKLSHDKPEKVPKWSRQQFEDKVPMLSIIINVFNICYLIEGERCNTLLPRVNGFKIVKQTKKYSAFCSLTCCRH